MLSDPSRYATVTGSNGRYRVTFPLIGGPGVAHVTAISNDARWCQIFYNAPYSSPGGDQHVDVRCFLPGGVEVPSRFAVTYLANDGTPSHSYDTYAYVAAYLLGGTTRQYNPTGATNVVDRLATGTYRVVLPGLANGTPDGSVQVTAEHPNSPRRCNVAEWFPKDADIVVYVQCVDGFGRPEDSWFNLTYHRRRPVFGAEYPPTNVAYLWTRGIGTETDYNSARTRNDVGVVGVGAYRVRFAGVVGAPDHMQVTAYGSKADYCHLADVWQIPPRPVVDSVVLCFDGDGRPTGSDFIVTYSSLA